MGHAAGQPADRLHLLRLPQLRLELPLLAHVLPDRDEVREPSLLVADRRDRLFPRERRAVLAPVGDLGAPHPPLQDRLPQVVIDAAVLSLCREDDRRPADRFLGE